MLPNGSSDGGEDIEIHDHGAVIESEIDGVAASEIVAVPEDIGFGFGPDLSDDHQLGVVNDDGLKILTVAGEGGRFSWGEGEFGMLADLNEYGFGDFLLVVDEDFDVDSEIRIVGHDDLDLVRLKEVGGEIASRARRHGGSQSWEIS